MDMGLVLLTLAFYVLVAARITRSINYDTLLDPMRLWIARRIYAGQAALADTPAGRGLRFWVKLQQFLGCPWCVGFWACAALAPAVIAVLAWPLWMWPVLAFAGSHLIGAADKLVADPLEIAAEDDDE